MSITLEVHKNIIVRYYNVHNNPYGYDFVNNIKIALNHLSTAEVGNRLLRKIADGHHTIYIKHNSNDNSARGTEDGCIRGRGCNTFIEISCSDLHTESPFFIRLAHELIHGYHNSYGKCLNSSILEKNVWENDEEYNTIVGLTSNKINRKRPKITENAIRLEHHLSERTSYIK